MMNDKLMLMIPGPTPVPEAALLALAKHPIGHRTSEFSNILAEVTANLKWLHQTESDVLMLTASGTGAVEAGIINFLNLKTVSLGNFSPAIAKLTVASYQNAIAWAEEIDYPCFHCSSPADC